MDAVYLWQDGSTQPTFTVTDSGTYYVEVANPCDTLSDTVNIALFPDVTVVLPAEVLVCPGDSVTLDAGSGFVAYNWQHGPTSQTVEVFENITYLVSVTDSNNCERIATTEVLYENCLFGLYVPNAFTPNNDRLNDSFSAVENKVTLTELRIYNRWGEHIYTLNSANDSWDGTLNGKACPEGVYTWIAEALNFQNTLFTRYGTLTLIR